MPGYTPAVAELDAYCREHGLTGSESEHTAPYLPHRITIRTRLGTKLTEAAGYSPELAATAILRKLHA